MHRFFICVGRRGSELVDVLAAVLCPPCFSCVGLGQGLQRHQEPAEEATARLLLFQATTQSQFMPKSLLNKGLGAIQCHWFPQQVPSCLCSKGPSGAVKWCSGIISAQERKQMDLQGRLAPLCSSKQLILGMQ